MVKENKDTILNIDTRGKKLDKNICDIRYNKKNRVGIVGDLDLYIPQSGSFEAFNLDCGVIYFIGVQSILIVEACVFCKSCRYCYEFVKKKLTETFLLMQSYQLISATRTSQKL